MKTKDKKVEGRPLVTAELRPLAVRKKTAARVLDIGTTKLDQLIADGTIKAVKAGKCLLIPTSELDKYVASLPRAVLHTTGYSPPLENARKREVRSLTKRNSPTLQQQDGGR